jgi:hypothetical protein
VDVEFNNINGGSFACTAVKNNSKIKSNDLLIENILLKEEKMGFDSPQPFLDFQKKILKHSNSLRELVNKINNEGKMILGYGASTKGNVLLQLCGFTENDIKGIVEVNDEKFGCLTPGTNIPILSEIDAKKMNPDYYLVLPWHFRESIIQREHEFLTNGGKIIFPLPEIEIVSY